MASAEGLHPIQTAFWEKHGLPCGFCTPGMIMAAAVEKALIGTAGDGAAIAKAAAHAVDGVTVASDIHADAEYRAQMARVETRRAIEAALAAGD
jgi:xanthine dehydrogenase iron-sulfur cluster and FAD-binding subunit A